MEYCYPYSHIDILNGLSWETESGRPLFLYAPDGGGKTTLLMSLAGRLMPEGEMLLDGKDLAAVPMKERAVAYADGTLMFFRFRSVRFNLEYPLKIRKVGKSERLSIVSKAAEEAGLPLSVKIRKLSFPQKIDALLARLSVIKRDIILFDGILSGAADAEEKQAAAERLKRFARNNTDKIIIFASADPAEAGLFQDAATFTLDAGKIKEGVHVYDFFEEE